MAQRSAGKISMSNSCDRRKKTILKVVVLYWELRGGRKDGILWVLVSDRGDLCSFVVYFCSCL
jgi:hypothetical protein